MGESSSPKARPAVSLPVIPLAGRGVRVIAGILDFIVIYLVTVGLVTRYFWPKYYPDLLPEYMKWQEMAAKDPGAIQTMEASPMMIEGVFFALVVISVITWFYFVFSEVAMKGSSLGKSVFGLRVMSLRGTPPNALEVGLRASIKAMCFLFFLPMPLLLPMNILLMLLHRQRRAAHDFVAQTVVVAGPIPQALQKGQNP